MSASPRSIDSAAADTMRVYLDHAASTTLRPEAAEQLCRWSSHTANSTGSHRPAREARRAVEDARDLLAAVLGCDRSEVVFGSGGTEADDLVISGARVDGALLCSAVEHPAVLEAIQRRGGRTIPVDATGAVDLDALEVLLGELDRPPGLVSVMTVNNEVGTVQPIAEVARRIRSVAPDAIVHTDAVQALPWVDLRPVGSVVDAVSISAHKFGGPTGVGASVISRGVSDRVAARQVGGGQELDRRSGTHHVAGIAAMGVAACLADQARDELVGSVTTLRDRLVDEICAALDGIVETGVFDGDRSHKVAGNAHLCVEGIDSEALLFLLDDAGVAASAASSCASGAQQRSHVLAAMGVPDPLARGAVRLSLGWTTTAREVDRAIEVMVDSVNRLRSRSTAAAWGADR